MKQRLAVATLVAGWAFILGLAGALPVEAAQDTTVEIQIEDQGAGPEIQVKQRGVGICKHSKCSNDVTWLWKKGDEKAGWRIAIEFSGGTPGAEQCFDQTRYVIDQPKSGSHTGEVSAAVTANCPAGKSAWFYDIKCEQIDGSPCGIPDVDPGVIIDG